MNAELVSGEFHRQWCTKYSSTNASAVGDNECVGRSLRTGASATEGNSSAETLAHTKPDRSVGDPSARITRRWGPVAGHCSASTVSPGGPTTRTGEISRREPGIEHARWVKALLDPSQKCDLGGVFDEK